CAGVLYLMKNVLHYSPLFINVLNDLLAVPVFLVVMEFLMKAIYGKRFKMTWTHILSTVITISLVFEVIFPLMSENPTADVVDVFLYMTGGMCYGLLLIKPGRVVQ